MMHCNSTLRYHHQNYKKMSLELFETKEIKCNETCFYFSKIEFFNVALTWITPALSLLLNNPVFRRQMHM